MAVWGAGCFFVGMEDMGARLAARVVHDRSSKGCVCILFGKG